MKQIMRIGDEYVPADADIQAIADTSNAIQETADANGTSVTAVIGKGAHSVTTVTGEYTAQRILVELALLVKYLSDKTGMDTHTLLTIVDAILRDTDISSDEP